MKRIIVLVPFLVVVVVVVVVVGASSENEENSHANFDNGPSRGRCMHALKNTRKHNSPTIMRGAETVDVFVKAVEQPEDANPSKIPSLMDPSNSVGLLDRIDIDLADRCFPKPECDPSAKFRTIDGGCNNLLFPVWGQAHTANTRIIRADYSDGISERRKAISGRELPDSRKIRTTIFKDGDKTAVKHSLMVMQFGQVIAHDTELTIAKSSSNGNPLKCCNPDGSAPNDLPKGCLPINISSRNNSVSSRRRCLSVPRASDTSDLGCQIRPVRQRIGVTSFVDASLLYGSDDGTATVTRTFLNGKLRKQVGSNGQSFLPNVKNATQFCNVVNANTVCYFAGDGRVNQHPDMAVQVISLFRLHNSLCESLRKINPSWDDERLYQEARRLLIAMYQHVTYNEFVPILVGRDYARANNLLPLTEGFDNNYDQLLNPTTITSFTSAAFRALHSYIQGFINLYNESRKITSKIRLSDFFSRSDIVQNKDNYDSFTRGLLTQNSQRQDELFTEEVSEFLFRNPGKSDGLDLISLDLERGRDFGIPSYNKFRQLCGLAEVKTFDDLADQIQQKHVDVLAGLYEDVNDIDYYVAGILENPKPGAVVGHTFQCVIGEMFFRWKFGDRFYYEFGDQPSSFTLDQLNEIRKTTLALIVCMTSNIMSVQRNAFDIPSNQNPLVSCKSIPKLDLSAWSEV